MTTNTEKILNNTIDILEERNKNFEKANKIIAIVSFILLISLILTFVYFSIIQNNLKEENKGLEFSNKILLDCYNKNCINKVNTPYEYPMLEKEQIIDKLTKIIQEQINIK